MKEVLNYDDVEAYIIFNLKFIHTHLFVTVNSVVTNIISAFLK